MGLVHGLISLYIWVLIIAALLSWFPSTPGATLGSIQRGLRVVTEPLLRPLRLILPRPRVGGVAIDFSVMVAIIGLQIVNSVI